MLPLLSISTLIVCQAATSNGVDSVATSQENVAVAKVAPASFFTNALKLQPVNVDTLFTAFIYKSLLAVNLYPYDCVISGVELDNATHCASVVSLHRVLPTQAAQSRLIYGLVVVSKLLVYHTP